MGRIAVGGADGQVGPKAECDGATQHRDQQHTLLLRQRQILLELQEPLQLLELLLLLLLQLQPLLLQLQSLF